VRFIGGTLIDYIFEPVFERLYAPLVVRINDLVGPGLVHGLLIGRLISGEIDFVQSLGLLTSGLFVPLGMVLPAT